MQDEHEAASIAGIVISDGKILIAHRNLTGQMGGRWEFPGGKLEAGETDEETVIREFHEEFGVEVEVGEKIAETSFFHNGKEVSLHAYRVFVPHNGIETSYVLSEHSEYRWAELSELEALPFVDSDMKLYPAVRKYIEALSNEA